MRIGFEAKRAFHNFRGLGNYSRTLIESLAKYYPDNQYFLYTPDFKNPYALNWSKSLSQFDADIYVRRPRSFISRQFPGLWRRAFQVSDIGQDKLDIYHGLSHEVPYQVEKSGAAAIVTIHDLIFMRYPEQFPWIDRKVYYHKFTQACKRSVRVIAICEQTKKDLMYFFNVPEKKIKVLYQSCDPRFYHLKDDSERNDFLNSQSLKRPYVLYVGAFEPRKNVLSLIKSYFKKSLNKDFDLVLIGKGQKGYQNQMKSLINKEGGEHCVHFFQNVDADELPYFYQGASLFVFPSMFEGFGLPIVEALFSRVPVITSKGSCFPESGGPKTCYVTAGDVDELSEKMEKVLGDEKLADEMVQMGHKFVQRFHSRNTSRSLMDFYQSLSS